MSKVITASAPSNIALIKYMGKSAVSDNLPANSSLSYTLDHLRSFVQLEQNDRGDIWEPLAGYAPIILSESGRNKFLVHLARLKSVWGVSGNFTVRSANNFPSDCGLASSASSFAALTKAVALLAREQGRPEPSLTAQSALSRQGSGSSCRSFFSPWALWRGEAAESVVGLPAPLLHAVVVVEDGIKAVSSSEAHKRIVTSTRWAGRCERAEQRLDLLLSALRAGDWRQAYQICWDEFEDMHALFETAQPAFTYRTTRSRELTVHLQNIWQRQGDGPLVTMDAGPNVHLLLRADQADRSEEWLRGLRVLKNFGVHVT